MFFLQLPEIKNYEGIGFKSFLIFIVICLCLAIGYLWRRINNLSDKITEIQDKHRSEILTLAEKSISVLASIESLIVKNISDITDKVAELIRTQHEKTRDEINKK